MGCFPSKNNVDRKVVPQSDEIPMKTKSGDAQPKSTDSPNPKQESSTSGQATSEQPPKESATTDSRLVSEAPVVVEDVNSSDGQQQRGDSAIGRAVSRDVGKPLEKLPPIGAVEASPTNSNSHILPLAAEGPTRPVAFEIPLDDSLFGATASSTSLNRSGNLGRLPSLGLTNDDIKAKLANADARWKVGCQIDRLLGDIENDEFVRKNSSRRVKKPELSSSTRPKTRQGRDEDPEMLKQRLIEKEFQAEKNRQRELAKLQSKLARMDEHVRRVQERKRFLEQGSAEDLSLSVSSSNLSLVA
ncbi:hypothetical protein DFS34DRAFT_685608 [Phlyctochytrium arcticum]|nr:hypothetical protein DFS34DRAFT_685608 [Phlyctochytrium arcticum]